MNSATVSPGWTSSLTSRSALHGATPLYSTIGNTTESRPRSSTASTNPGHPPDIRRRFARRRPDIEDPMKNIVICCDGTGNEYGRNNTNVA